MELYIVTLMVGQTTYTNYFYKTNVQKVAKTDGKSETVTYIH